MAWQQPKTDWTAQDTYEAADLNRVESNTALLAAALAAAGYPPALGDIVIDRDEYTIEFAASLNRVEQNIHALAVAFVPLPGYKTPKIWTALQAFDHNDANRLERNLQLLYQWLQETVAGFRYCGTFACGEGGEIY